MPRRTLLVLLILVGVAAVAGILYWTFYPAYQQRQAAQPPALTGTVPTPTFDQNQPLPVVTPQLPTASTTPQLGSAEERERQAQEALKQQMISFSGRVGSYGNADGFDGLRQAGLLVSSAMKTQLETQRQGLLAKYQRTDLSFVQTTKGLSALITQGRPVLSASKAQVAVQVQQTISSAEFTTPQTSYLEWTFEVERQGSDWVVTGMSSKPFEPR